MGRLAGPRPPPTRRRPRGRRPKAFATIHARVPGLALGVLLVVSAGCGLLFGAPAQDLPPVVSTGDSLPDSPAAPAAALPAPTVTAGHQAPDPLSASGPLTLEDAIALGFERNPDVLAAADRIGEARARLQEASSAFYPRLSTRFSYARTTSPLEAFGMIVAQRRFSPALDVNQPGETQNVRPEIVAALPLFRGGQDYQRRAAAALGAEAAELDRSALRNALAENVTAAFYALSAAPEQVEATRASIEAVESALAAARARLAAGTALRSETLSLEVRLAAARAANLRAANAVALARSALTVLLGLEPQTPIEITTAERQAVPQLPDTFAAAHEQALALRPEIAAADRVVAIREREVRAERAGYLPRIDAVGRYGQDARDLGISRRQDNWTVGAIAEVDIFSGFETTARVRAAQHRLAQARRSRDKTRLAIAHEVETALLAVAEARQQAEVREAAVVAAEEALRLVGAQYRAGTATVTRYIEAETARADALAQTIAARYEVRRSEASLLKATGVWGDR